MTKIRFVFLLVAMLALTSAVMAKDTVDDMIAIGATASQSAAASSPSAAGIRFDPRIEDGDFQYFQAKDDDAKQQTAYFTLAVVDGEVTVQLSESPSAGSLEHTFDAIGPRPTNGEWRQLFGPARLDEVEAQEDDRTKLVTNLRELAGMESVRNGWAITHGELSLSEAVDAYQTWFGQAGGQMTLDPANATSNVRPYDVSGVGNELRVVFHREGSGVQVYIGNR